MQFKCAYTYLIVVYSMGVSALYCGEVTIDIPQSDPLATSSPSPSVSRSPGSSNTQLPRSNVHRRSRPHGDRSLSRRSSLPSINLSASQRRRRRNRSCPDTDRVTGQMRVKVDRNGGFRVCHTSSLDLRSLSFIGELQGGQKRKQHSRSGSRRIRRDRRLELDEVLQELYQRFHTCSNRTLGKALDESVRTGCGRNKDKQRYLRTITQQSGSAEGRVTLLSGFLESHHAKCAQLEKENHELDHHQKFARDQAITNLKLENQKEVDRITKKSKRLEHTLYGAIGAASAFGLMAIIQVFH